MKYFITSVTENEPISTALHSKKAKLSELLYKENTGVYANDAVIGEVMSEDVISTASNTNSYKMDVKGMKQVKWPGLNHARLGGVFTDESNCVLGIFIMSVSHTYFDFSIGECVFCDVPSGANGSILLLFATLVMLSVFLWIVPALRLLSRNGLNIQ